MSRRLPIAIALVLSACQAPPAGDAPIVTAPTRQSHEAFFPIETGPHGGVECDACHGRSDSFAEFRCLDCHEHGKERTDADHRGVEGYVYASPSCYECHPRGEAGDLSVDHEAIFPIDEGSAHAEVGCMECHADRADRSKLLCATCHVPGETEPIHAEVEGFAQDSRTCVRCHADSQVDRVAEHGPFRIQAGAPHETSACLDCHPALRADKSFGADFAKQACVGCHLQPETTSQHVAVDGFVFDDAWCLSCHSTGEKNAPVEHDSFPILGGAAHSGRGCSECHASGADRSQLLCATCHAPAETTPQHAVVPGFVQESVSCVRCHADAQVSRVAAHQPFGIQAGSAHAGESCLDCHPSMRADKPFGADFSRQLCTDCHGAAETDATHVGIAGYAHDTATCLGCHPAGTVEASVDHAGLFPIGPGTAHASVDCAACHADPGDRSVLACATCHNPAEMTPAHGQVGGFRQESASCLLCHADSQVFRLGGHTPFRVTSGPHDGEPCAECHAARRADRPYPAISFDTYSCPACHSQSRMDDVHDGRSGYRYESTTCTNCHADGSQ